jgi:hypothetical protein
MALTRFKVCSLALTEIGLRPISSFVDNTNLDAAEVCGELWDHYSEYLLTVHPWRFNMKKVQLAQVVQAPVNEWRYAFQKPADCIKIHAAWESDSNGILPYKRYELFEDKVFSDIERLWIDYQYYRDAPFWPTYFTEFAVMAFAAKLAPILTDNTALADRKDIAAWGLPQERRRGGLLAVAKLIDSQQAPSEPISSSPLISARFS